MNVCPACNTENLDGEIICHQCGGALSAHPTFDCVVCAAPVKIGAKFCKRCGSAQPETKAPAAPSGGATRQAHIEDDSDNDKTVIMSPQAREVFMAQHMAQRQQPSPTVFPSATPAPAVPDAPALVPAPAPRETSLRDQIKTSAPAPKRSYVAIALGAGAFVVAALVSTLLLMSGGSQTPAQESGTLPVVSADPGMATDPANSAPLVDAASSAATPAVAIAPQPETQSLPQAAVITPAVVTPAVTSPAPVAPAQTLPAATAPTENANATSGRATKSESTEAAVAPKPKSKSKQDSGSAAAKRKQAEDALNRLLNQ